MIDIILLANENTKSHEHTQRTEVIFKKQHVLNRIASNRNTLNNISEKAADVSSIESRWTRVKALSNTANGKLSDKEKIMPETYIQMPYFDRVIFKVNTRLMIMSGGQYELKRRRESGNNAFLFYVLKQIAVCVHCTLINILL